jgi:hypothetical protein
MHLMLDLVQDFSDASPSWEDHVAVLQAAEESLREATQKRFDAICLVGDNEVIPMAETGDLTETDDVVESDSVYSTLCTGDPWQDEEARSFTRAVGRLPVGRGWSVGSLAAYLKNVALAGSASVPRSLVQGVSAQCWREASQAVLQDVGGGLVQASPDVTHETVIHRWDQKSPWHYFNLHGAMEEPAWYGEGAVDYPVAFMPHLLTRLQSLNVVGVEACYGARYIGLSAEESAVLAALSHKTIAFLGSTRIAFGPPRPPNGLADVMIRDFLKLMRQGATSGEAHRLARLAVATTLDEWDADPAVVIKTLLSFNLFGDPSGRMGKAPAGISRLASPPRVHLRDTLAPVRALLDASLAETQKRLQTLMESKYRELQGVTPKVNSIGNGPQGERFRWGWKTKSGPLTKYWLVLTDKAGKALAEIHSR